MDFQKLDDKIRSVFGQSGSVSMSIGVVHDGRVVWTAGYGSRSAEGSAAPDENTRFPIGSSTKSMTATCLGILHDEGKLDWDTPVIEYIPEFRMYDEYATMHTTPRDMLCHRTGVPRYDFAWLEKDRISRSTSEIVGQVRYCKPNKGFRYGYEYNNFMYAASALLVERLSGMSYEEFMQEKIFRPLSMDSSTTRFQAFTEADNKCTAYTVDMNGEVQPADMINMEPISGAGAVISTVSDMCSWLIMNLNGGEFNGNRIISGESLSEIHKPQVMENGLTLPLFDETPMSSYGFGWFIRPYRGHRCIMHGGNVPGFSGNMAMLPDENLGIYAVTNMTGDFLPYAAIYTIFDEYLGAPETDWMPRYKKVIEEGRAALKDNNEKILNPEMAIRAAAGALETYAGRYTHPGFGTAEILACDEGLMASYLGNHYDFAHVTGDTFAMNINGRHVPAYTTARFIKDDFGRISSLEMNLESSAPESIRFDRED